MKILLSPLMTWLRLQDYVGGQRPDILIAASNTVQARIKKYYRRESHIIYPPVTIPSKSVVSRKKEYFLVVSRLVKQKGVDLAIKACNTLKTQLVVVGQGKEENNLRALAGSTIQFRGFVPDDQMHELYSKAKALIYCSQEEDFGLVPVEAMAYGVPVIAQASGGARETVIQGKTGILFNSFTVESLTEAIQLCSVTNISPLGCQKRAQTFSEARFHHKMTRLILHKIKQQELCTLFPERNTAKVEGSP